MFSISLGLVWKYIHQHQVQNSYYVIKILKTDIHINFVYEILSSYLNENGDRFVYDDKPAKVVQGNDQCLRRGLNNRRKYNLWSLFDVS